MADDDNSEFQKGDLESVMARHDHVKRWVEDFEAQHGSRPYFYGPLDRGAKSLEPRNLIYTLKPPLFAHTSTSLQMMMNKVLEPLSGLELNRY